MALGVHKHERPKETSAHRAERRQRQADRMAVKLAAACQRLAAHHGSAVPRILRPFLDPQRQQECPEPEHASKTAPGGQVPCLRKTQFCRHYRRGKCTLQETCAFAHSHADLGKPRPTVKSQATTSGGEVPRTLRADAPAFKPAATSLKSALKGATQASCLHAADRTAKELLESHLQESSSSEGTDSCWDEPA